MKSRNLAVAALALAALASGTALAQDKKDMPKDAKEALGTPAIDPLVTLVSIGVITLVAFLAGWFPARRAANIDPIEALRG